MVPKRIIRDGCGLITWEYGPLINLNVCMDIEKPIVPVPAYFRKGDVEIFFVPEVTEHGFRAVRFSPFIVYDVESSRGDNLTLISTYSIDRKGSYDFIQNLIMNVRKVGGLLCGVHGSETSDLPDIDRKFRSAIRRFDQMINGKPDRAGLEKFFKVYEYANVLSIDKKMPYEDAFRIAREKFPGN